MACPGPTLPTVSLASSAVWHLLLGGGKEKEAMSGVGLAICSRLSSGCSSLRGPVDDHDPEGADNFSLTSSIEHQKPELVGLPGADLKACPAWFQPQPVQNMPHAGEAPVRRLTHPLTLHTDTQSHPQTRPLAGLGRGAASPSTERPCPLPLPASADLHTGEGPRNELLPWFWGWVLTRVKNFVGNRFPRKGLFFEKCVLGLHGCVGGAASSHGPVGTCPGAWLCVSPTAPLAVPVSPRQYSVHG